MARIITGLVTSNKNDKTIVITMTERRTHPLYKKQYTVKSKFMAHDEKNEAKVGDLVNIKETRPMSARKRFMLDKIVERGGAHFEEADATADIPEEELAPKAAAKAEEPKDGVVEVEQKPAKEAAK